MCTVHISLKKKKKTVVQHLIFNVVTQKRFYNRESIRGIRISRLAKILLLYHDELKKVIRKGVDYFIF